MIQRRCSPGSLQDSLAGSLRVVDGMEGDTLVLDEVEDRPCITEKEKELICR